MKCRFCGYELPKGEAICPECNKKNGATWQIVAAIVAGVVLMACLAVVLLVGIGGKDFSGLSSLFKGKEPAAQQENQQNVTPPADNTGENTETDLPAVELYESAVDYSGTEEEANQNKEVVIATVGDKTLTNRLLQFYFNLEVSNFVNNNFQNLTYYGFDYNTPLNEQKSYDADMSWEAYFVVKAINTWHQYQSVYALAQEAGFQLSEESQEHLDSLRAMMEEYAQASEFESVDAWLQDYFDADITYEDYMEYSRVIALSSEYAMEQVSNVPSKEALEAYYEENIQYFEEFELTKDSGAIVSVRHILLQPKSSEEATTYTEEEWDACLAEAEKILKEWKDGEATEESFAELANKHSADGGSNTTGGLYEGITKETPFVESFLNWCMDETRQIGDTDIVKSEHGYHIMYFSATQPQWEYYATQWIMEDREIELISNAMETYPVETDMDKVCIREFQFY